ncbi:hypothetical protein W911_10535 [Hyphomicrobium nitrativorans NL23]|uniref:Uncharacterized protein n=1 Tax=Hyphomicrobium nitrativorans NL23 TaxID=1029756 RepID=V5SJC0_9HYPH|nr:hypothetical protein [Hyphomicrobium nitrativorans]AHB50190.1 hypothetical protein W911_10535 [Hyphomicrobium nitrativorans NL23]
MPRTALLLLAAFALLPPVTSAAEAGRRDDGKRLASQTKPLKDCTRLNARYGYYANPWCTAAEQDRWDRWEARRLSGRR